MLGGDGTILRAAELVREGTAPVLGINMGHVGFLAEIERDDMDDAVRRVIARDYAVEERLALQVRVKDAADEVVYETWALNEATVEKASRERMLEVVIEVDGRPLSTFGCDGVVVSTPTGSTAYNFSAGGPVIWPTVEAIAVVPLSAHALFAKPLVVGPEHAVAIEVLERTNGIGVLWCDGRRSHDLPPGARVVVRRSDRPVRLARLTPPRSPTASCASSGFRSRAGADLRPRRPVIARPVIEEMRLRDLGVIAEATLPIGPGFTAITGETGAGKTMVVTGLGLLLGQRADSGAVRAGAAQASVDGVWIVPEHGAVADRVREAGGDRRAARRRPRRASSSGARSQARAAAAPASAAGRRRPECSPTSPTSSSSCTASPTSCACAPLRLSATHSTASAAPSVEYALLESIEPRSSGWRAIDRELTSLTADRDARAREAEELRVAMTEIEAGRSAAGRGRRARRRAERLANVEELRAAAAAAHDALSGDGDAPDVGMLLAEARRALERAPRSGPRRARRPGRRPRLPRSRPRRLAGGLSRRPRRDRAA